MEIALTWENIPDETIIPFPVEKTNQTEEQQQRTKKRTQLEPANLTAEAMEVEKADQEKEPEGKTPFDALIDKKIDKINSAAIWKAIERGQDGDAELFIKLFKDVYVYDCSEGAWFYFNDHYWRQDKKDQALAAVSKVVDVYTRERKRLLVARRNAERAGKVNDVKKIDFKIDLINKRIAKLHTLAYKKNVLELSATGVDSLAIAGDEWDRNPMVLAAKNGCIDLSTGVFSDGKPEDMIRQASPVPWEGINAIPKTWIGFLHGSLGGDQELINYIQRLLGYAITGVTYENIYPILWGEHGQNGKGTLIETVKEIIGKDMAVKLASDFLMQKNLSKSSGAPDAELYSLRGARIAWCSETNKNERINASKIKELSGSDTISARPPYAKRPIVFKPTHLIFILTNMRPQIPADDQALWLRTHLIQFNYSFVENPDPGKEWERKKDHKLSEKLRDEYPAILAWMVRGCLEWQKKGLKPPEKIRAVTEMYRKSEDIFQDFLDDVLIKAEAAEQVKRKLIFQTYCEWCLDNGYKRMNLNHFCKALSRKIGEPDKRTRVYSGYTVYYDKDA